jgi:type II secretory pathway component PulF
MGWREILYKEIRLPLPGLPAGWAPRRPQVPFFAWYAQRERHDMRAIFTQLAAIVSTNASLPHGLRACAEDAPNREVARTLRTLAARTESGLTLGEAMAASGRPFRPHWTGLVLASERTGALAGALASILDEINSDLDGAHLTRNRITYFVTLVAVQSSLMAFVVVRVMPIFSEVLADFDGSQPAAVGVFYFLQYTVAWHFRTLLVLAALGALLVLAGPTLFRLSKLIQTAVTYLVLPLPVFGTLYRARMLESLASMLHVLCQGGMPMSDALRQAALGLRVRPFARAVERAAEAYDRGDALSDAFARSRFLLGARFIEIVRLGEGREDLAGAFAQARDLYRRSVVRRRRALSDALVPLGVAICGSGVLLASMSLYTMLTAIADGITASL